MTLSHVTIAVADPENGSDLLDVSCLPRRLLQLLILEILDRNPVVGLFTGYPQREANAQAFTSSNSYLSHAVINLHPMFSRATFAAGPSEMPT